MNSSGELYVRRGTSYSWKDFVGQRAFLFLRKASVRYSEWKIKYSFNFFPFFFFSFPLKGLGDEPSSALGQIAIQEDSSGGQMDKLRL